MLTVSQMDEARVAMLVNALPKLTYRRWAARDEHAGEKQRMRDRDARQLVAEMLGCEASDLAVALDWIGHHHEFCAPDADCMQPGAQARFILESVARSKCAA